MLSDPRKRSIYDRYGMKGVQDGGHDGGGVGMFQADELFSHLFGGGLFGGFGGGPRRRHRPEDTVLSLAVTLEDLYNGKTAQVPLDRRSFCSVCQGKGCKTGARKACQTCTGTGLVYVYKEIPSGSPQKLKSRCPECMGAGNFMCEDDKCTSCDGQGVQIEHTFVEVQIDKGMTADAKMYFRGDGDRTPGYPPGDVIVLLSMIYHDDFARDRDNLSIDRTITLVEALCGFTMVITHLDGRELVVRHPPGVVIKPGDKRVIAGEGMPVHKTPDQKGNMFIAFDVEFPPNNFATIDLLQKLEELLPSREAFVMPEGEHVEEVELLEFKPERKPKRYSSDESDEDGGSGLQCAQQ